MTNNREVNSRFGGSSRSAFTRLPQRNRPPPPPPRPRSPIPVPSTPEYSVPSTSGNTVSGILSHNNNARARSSQARFNATYSNFNNYLENLRFRMLSNRIERTSPRNISEQNFINYIKYKYPSVQLPNDVDFRRLIEYMRRTFG